MNSTRLSTAIDFAKTSLVSLETLNRKVFEKNIVLTSFGVVIYFLAGTMVYRYWGEFGSIETAYFTVVTFSTVGYGDVVPTTPGLRLFTAFYILVGVVVLTFFISAVNDVVAMRIEMRQEREAESTVKELSIFNRVKETLKRSHLKVIETFKKSSKSSNKDYTATVDPSSADRRNDLNHVNNEFSAAVSGAPTTPTLTEYNLMNKQMERMRSIYLESHKKELNKLRWNTFVDVCTILLLVVAGALFMGFNENWGADASIYWSVVTLCTVGYGDLIPQENGSKIFVIFYIVIGCTFMGKAFSEIVRYPIVARQCKSEMRVLDQFGKSLTKETLLNLVKGNTPYMAQFPGLKKSPDEMTKSEFCIVVFHLMNKIDSRHLAVTNSLFELLDVGVNGVLNESTLSELYCSLPTDEEISKRKEFEKNRKRWFKFKESEYPSSSSTIPERYTDRESGEFRLQKTVVSAAATINHDVECGSEVYNILQGTSPHEDTVPPSTISAGSERDESERRRDHRHCSKLGHTLSNALVEPLIDE